MNTAESSASIARWAEDAFGEVTCLDDLVTRAFDELEELRGAIEGKEPLSDITAEVADVAILLHRIVALCGRELSDAVDGKMRINRTRRWQRAGNGTGQHV